MSGPVIAIVQCGARKLGHAAPARDLYTGPLFRSLRQCAEAIADRWYIASALHGLVEPSTVLEPYDVTLHETCGELLAWGARIGAELRAREPAGVRVVALCSSRYLWGWADEWNAEKPIQGLTLGHARQRAGQLVRASHLRLVKS